MASNVPTLEPDDVVNIAEPTASSNFEAQVQAKMPAAKKAVAAYSPIEQLGAYQPFQFGQIPMVGPAYNKAIDLAKAVTGSGQGKSLTERYTDIQAERAAIENAKYAAAPKTYSFMSGIPGAASVLLPEIGLERGAAALTENAPALVKNVTPYLGRMTESGLMSAASSEALPGETPEETAKRLGTSFGAGAAATPVASAITGGVKAVKNIGSKIYGLFDPESVMAQKIVEGASTQPSVVPSQRQLSVEEYLDALNRGDKNVSLADVQGAKPLIQSAEQHLENDPNALALNSVINKRIADNPRIIGEQIDDAAGKPINIFEERRAADKAYRSASSPAYNAAFNSNGADAVWNPYFNTVINTKEGQAAIDFANNERIKDGDLTPSPFSKDPQTGLYVLRSPTGQIGAQQPPDLEYWDYVKRGLNSVWRGQKSDPKEADTAASTGAMMHQFTDVLKQQFPLYDKATSTAQRYIKADNAFDAGSDFFTMISKPKGNAEDIGQQMNYLTAPPKTGGYTPAEKNSFKTGLLSFVKENPDAAANVFKNMDSQTEQRLRAALGDDTFEGVNDAFRMARVRELTGTLGLSVKNKSDPNILTSLAKLGLGAAGIGAGVGAGFVGAQTAITHAPELLERMTDPYFLGSTAAALGIGIPAVYLGSKTVSGLANQRASAMLRMAADPNPQVQKQLSDALNKDELNRKIFSNLETRLTNYVATNPDMNPFAPSDTTKASGGRIGHASGGRAGSSVMTPEQLLRDLKRRQVMMRNTTEHMLSLPDDAVVQALDAAKR